MSDFTVSTDVDTLMRQANAADISKQLVIAGVTSLGINVASGPIALGEIQDTTARPLQITQTWNNSGFAGDLLKLTVTVTAADAAANFLNCLGGAAGTTQLAYIRRDGFGLFTGLFCNGAMTVSTTLTMGNFIAMGTGASGYITTNGGSPANLYFAGAEGTSFSLAVKNGTNACLFRVYGTTTGNKYAQITHDGTDATVSASSGKIILSGSNRATYDAAPSTTVIRDILISHGLMAAS